MNVTLRGFAGSGGVACAPETTARLRSRIIKIGSPHGHVEWRRSDAAYGQARGSNGLSRKVVAACRAVISGGDHHSDALSCGFLADGVIKCISPGSQTRLAYAKTLAHDRRNVVVDDV